MNAVKFCNCFMSGATCCKEVASVIRKYETKGVAIYMYSVQLYFCRSNTWISRKVLDELLAKLYHQSCSS